MTMSSDEAYPISRGMAPAFHGPLLAWFARHRRDLPWRRRRTAYRVWVSENMLQQTRIDQAMPYFHRFMAQFPTLAALAGAERQAVLKVWEGLGYYSRAVRMQETARYLMRERGGRFPRTYEGLLALPGIGPYSAAAIASLAFGLDHAVLDGNVIRVMARVLALPEVTDLPRTRRGLQATLDRLLPRGRAGEFNEAIMELGALVCLPARPDCGSCPLAQVCRGRAEGEPTRYPVRKAKKKLPHRHVGAGVIIDDRGRVLIARRHEDDMLGGMWEFPGGGVEEGETLPECIRRELKEELDLDVRVGPHLVTVRHTFSHFRMDLHAYWVRVTGGRPRALGCDGWKWVPRDKLDAFPFPKADQKILAAVRAAGPWPAF